VRSPASAPPSRLRRLLYGRAGGPVPRWRTRMTAGLAGAALAVTAVASVVAVSANARPGEALYGLKRGTEQTQLALAGSGRGQTLLDFAATRLAELDGLVHERAADQGLLLATLRAMDIQTTEGASWLTARAVSTRSTGAVQRLGTWTSGQSTGLSALVPEMPTGARTAAGRSLDLLRRVDVRAAGLTAALACAGGPSTRGTDALGPVPAACPTRTGSPAQTGTAVPARANSPALPTTPQLPLPLPLPTRAPPSPGLPLCVPPLLGVDC
jgi:Domain of unknown function (DUF5667)